MFQVPEQFRVPYHPVYGKMDSSLGNNGVFFMPVKSDENSAEIVEIAKTKEEIEAWPLFLVAIASDGQGWDHVSVTVHKSDRVPTHYEMLAVRNLFWGEDDYVLSFFPPKANYVNYHPGCLHLWRPSETTFPVPPTHFVGLTDAEKEKYRVVVIPGLGYGLVDRETGQPVDREGFLNVDREIELANREERTKSGIVIASEKPKRLLVPNNIRNGVRR